MICPKCNREFSEEFDHCLVCGAKLADYTPIVAEPIMDEEQPMVTDENLPQLLVTVMGEEEARQTVKDLQDMNIPCLCKKSEEGEDFYDLSVPASLFHEALALLEQWDQAETPEELPEEKMPVCSPFEGKKWYELW